MGSKFIPNADDEFRKVATNLAAQVVKDPERFMLNQQDAEALDGAVKAFCAALAVARAPGSRTAPNTIAKKQARQRAVREVRRCANVIRASDRISAADKIAAGIKQRPQRLGKRTCPQEPPILRYMGAECEGGLTGTRHVLQYTEGYDYKGRQKPHGATRIELFVDLVADGDDTPAFPGQFLGGRPWYLRSFTKSPIKVVHPVPPVPMLVVYWARWADAKGNVGKFSQTCVARVEGGFAAGAKSLLGAMPQVKLLRNDPKYLTTVAQLRQIEQVTVERMLPDGGGADDATREAENPPATPKQIPLIDAA